MGGPSRRGSILCGFTSACVKPSQTCTRSRRVVASATGLSRTPGWHCCRSSDAVSILARLDGKVANHLVTPERDRQLRCGAAEDRLELRDDEAGQNRVHTRSLGQPSGATEVIEQPLV